MPRTSDPIKALAAEFAAQTAKIVSDAREEGRQAALAELQAVIGKRGVGGKGKKRGPGRPKGSKNKPKAAKAKKGGKKRKSSWAGLTPAQKLARVNAIRKGRGLPEKKAL